MKNILVFSDGTANDTGGQANKLDPELQNDKGLSNIFRMYVATNEKFQPNISATEQLSFYDAGLGSTEEVEPMLKSSASLFGWVTRPLYKGLSQATGFGITRNIVDCYRFFVEVYEPGDKIFLFGFSRGAYTVRSLGGLLSLLGVFQKGNLSKQQINKAIKESVAIYKIREPAKRTEKASKVKSDYHQVVPHVIGVFDTVRALGITGGVTRVIGSVTERFAPHKFHDHSLNSEVPYAFQAVSIDENRKHFSVELWDNNPTAHKALEQRWFPGVHSDIGGSYPDGESGTGRDLGRVTLAWMLDRLEQNDTGLLVNRDVLDIENVTDSSEHHLGEMHNERAKKRLGIFPTGWFWPEGFRTRAASVPLGSDDSVLPDQNGIIEGLTIDRFKRRSVYRPEALRNHPEFSSEYT